MPYKENCPPLTCTHSQQFGLCSTFLGSWAGAPGATGVGRALCRGDQNLKGCPPSSRRTHQIEQM